MSFFLTAPWEICKLHFAIAHLLSQVQQNVTAHHLETSKLKLQKLLNFIKHRISQDKILPPGTLRNYVTMNNDMTIVKR